jgi:hypothetical protein
MRYVLSLALGLFTLNAYAAFTLTELETDQARAGLQASLLQNVPMVQVLSNYVPTYLTKATELAAELKKFPQWEALASARRGPFTLVVETPVQREVQGRALKPQLQTDRWNSISEIGSKYSTDPSLHARLKEVALSLSARDSRALLTGVINSLPPEKRGPYFKLGAPAAQLQGLQGEEALTDQALSANFRAAAFGFTPEQVQRSFLLATIEESIQLERELELLARTAWFRLMKDRDSSALDLNPENVRALAARSNPPTTKTTMKQEFRKSKRFHRR